MAQCWGGFGEGIVGSMVLLYENARKHEKKQIDENLKRKRTTLYMNQEGERC